jgi:hypothetical protein
MAPIGRSALALFAFSMLASAQDNPLAWFPLQVGSHWVYEHEAKSGDRNRPDVDRWTTEETITRWVTIPEGLVVLRQLKQQADSTDRIITVRAIAPNGQLREIRQPAYNRGILSGRDGEPYLVRGKCVFVIDGGGWDFQRQQLRPEYRKYFNEGAVSPDLCFSLQTGRKWGNNDISWRVEPARNDVGSFLPTEYQAAVHIFSDHFGSGGLEDVWFQKGIGIVGVHYLHNGTYDEYTKKLVSFVP